MVQEIAHGSLAADPYPVLSSWQWVSRNLKGYKFLAKPRQDLKEKPEIAQTKFVFCWS